MPVTARRFIRKMRGGAQSHLLEADDGHFYVVKFQNNPQHRRILVNELVASVLLEYLQISAPESALVEIDEEFLAANPEIGMSLGTRRVPVEPGWHFGSRYPGDPCRIAVYDFVPDGLLEQVVNVGEFLGIFVFDKWTANADGRQSIFHRAMVRPAHAALPPTPGFVARMIDHGFIFNGPHWEFSDSPLQGLYPRRSVYARVASLDDFQPWLDRIRRLPHEVLDLAWKRVPSVWIEDEEDAFERLLEALMARRARVPDLIAATRDARPNPFPNWR
jgi:hypothetical protein